MIAKKLPTDHDRTTYYKAQSTTGGKARHPVDNISRKRRSVEICRGHTGSEQLLIESWPLVVGVHRETRIGTIEDKSH